MRDYMISIGVKIPITGTNWFLCDELTEAHLDMDFMDSHTYFYDWRWNDPLTMLNSLTDQPQRRFPLTAWNPAPWCARWIARCSCPNGICPGRIRVDAKVRCCTRPPDHIRIGPVLLFIHIPIQHISKDLISSEKKFFRPV